MLSVIVAVDFALPLSGQAPPADIRPGDPVSEADKMFVNLDTSSNSTCGVTAANNIRCWGENSSAPIWAGGFTDVAVGVSHSCGIKLDGTVQCWGVNRLGANMLTPPTDGGVPIKFKTIDSFQYHTCGIRADNDRLHCWGHDSHGQASGNSSSSSNVSYDYSSDSFAKISTSSLHTCGLVIPVAGDTGTNIRCWGNGSTTNEKSVVPQPYSATLFKDIDSGPGFTCGLIDGGDDDGKAVCWGTASYGIVVNAVGTVGRNLQLSTPSVERFTRISSGYYHVCGIKTDDTISCWGATKASGIPQAYGQADVPSEHRNSTFSNVISAEFHTCAILDGQNGQTEGDVVCWGAEIPYDPLRPGLVPGGRIFHPDYPYPPPHRFPQISSGQQFNCGLSARRDLVCWGGSVLSPGIVDGPFKTLDMGEFHVCAIRDNGRINCWGHDTNRQASGWSVQFDQIEEGTQNPTALYNATSRVKGLTTDYTFKSVSASRYHTCGILDGRTQLQTEGAVICWGNNQHGKTTPPEGATFSSVSAGWFHTCGLLDAQNGQSAGTAVCWGHSTRTNIPEEVQDVAFSSLSSGRFHTCGIRSDNGRMTCWGSAVVAAIPEEFVEQSFSAVAVGEVTTCGITSEKLAKCWGWSGAPTVVEQFRIPTDYAETRFVVISSGRDHACATKENGKVICWGADADVSTPQLEIYRPHSTVPGAFTIINTRQAWVPREFRASPINLPPTPTPLPLVWPDIVRIEPSIRGVSLLPGKAVFIGVEVYGRQDIRDDSLGDQPGITFDWSSEDLQSRSASGNGGFAEDVRVDNDRGRNGLADDRRVLYTAPDDPGRYRIRVALEVGPECLGAREGESEQDAVERCSAVFDVTVLRRSIEPSPSPVPVDPEGAIPEVIVDRDGRNYEVFTPEGGGEFTAEKCQFKAPRGAVNNGEVIGVSIAVLEDDEDKRSVADHRFMTDGVQCRIDAVDSQGARLVDYQVVQPGEVCMPLPKAFYSNMVDALLVVINDDRTLTRLTSKLYLVSPKGLVKVCGNLGTLSATTVVALPGEVAEELPPTPVPTPESPDTGGSRLSEANWMMAMIFGVAMLASVAALVGRRRKGMG